MSQFPTFRYHYLNPQGLEGIQASGIRSGVLNDGELLVGSTGNPAVKTTLTPGNGVTIENNPGQIIIHASAAIPSIIVDPSQFQTPSITDVTIPSMNFTPIAGDYIIIFSGTHLNSLDEETTFTIYRDGVAVPSTVTTVSPTKNKKHYISTQALLLDMDGTEVVEVKVRGNGGTIDIFNRRLLIQKVL